MNIQLMIIDGQNDFCLPTGKLFVAGAEKQAKENVPRMIRRLASKDLLTDIHATMDSHHPLHIAHPKCWKDSAGNHPGPFTIITAADMVSGKWSPSNPAWYSRFYSYLKALEASGRYPHCIWPPHCLIGSPGHNMVSEIWDALTEWEESQQAIVDYVTKGSNFWTEHFSAVKAEVPDSSDPTTQLNTELVRIISESDLTIWVGWAGSHCLANTARDTVAAFADPSIVKRMCFIEDGTAPVPGFTQFQDQFFNDMIKMGAQISTTDKILI